MWGDADAARMRQVLGVAILGKSKSPDKRALSTVAVLEEEMFARGWPVGAALGTFSNLQRRCGVGRPAFRAAMNILDAQGLVEIRRGGAGGVFVSQPPISKVCSELLLFLSFTDTRYLSIIEARQILLQAAGEALIDSGAAVALEGAPTGDATGFPLWLAALTGNPALHLLAQLVAELHQRCAPPAAPAAADQPSLAQALICAINAQDRTAVESIGRAYASQGGPDPEASLASLASIDVADIFKCDKTAAELAVRLLKAILGGEGPARIGSIEDLAERYGGAELTVRQAVRMLEEIGVLQCQRGRKGGVVLAFSQQRAIIRRIHYCLAACGASISDNLQLAGFLDRSLPRLLGERMKGGLAPANMNWPEMPSPLDSYLAAVTNQVTAENRLLELAGNPVLAVLTRALALHFLRLRFAKGGDAPVRNHMPAIATMYRDIFAAFGRGDTQRALEIWGRKAELMARTLNAPPRAAAAAGPSGAPRAA